MKNAVTNVVQGTVIGIAACVLACGAAGAQEESPRRIGVQERAAQAETVSGATLASRLLGAAVRGRGGEDVGHLWDLVVQPQSGRIALVVLEVERGGGTVRVLVPPDVVRTAPRRAAAREARQVELVLEADPAALRAAPELERDALDDRDRELRARRAFGVDPEPGPEEGGPSRVLASELRGVEIDVAGDTLGDVSDLGIDLGRAAVLYVLVRPEGAFGAEHVLPWRILEVRRSDDRIAARATVRASEIEAAPRVGAAGGAPDAEVVERAFTHFGLDPREARAQRVARAAGEVAELRFGEWLLGADVHDEEGTRIGRMRDLLVQPRSGLVTLVVMKADTPAKGERYVAVPFAALRVELAGDAEGEERPEEERVHVVLTGEEGAVDRAPTIGRENIADAAAIGTPELETRVLRAFPRVAAQRPTRDPKAAEAPRMLLSRIRGAEVQAPDGSELGEIRDVAIDPDRERIRFALLGRGQEEGPLVVVPWDALALDVRETGGAAVRLDVDPAELRRAPAIRPAEWRRLTESEFLRRVAAHFGTPAVPREAAAPRERDDERR